MIVLPTLRELKPEGTELVRHLFSPAPGRRILAFGLIMPFSLAAPGQEADPPPAELWPLITQALGETILDEGWPKPRGEWLAAGHCFPPSGHSDQPVSVRIEAGPISKQLAVFGPRVLGPAGTPSRPQAFERMPITLAHAWGGPGTANPLGRPMAQAGDELPNVELPARLIVSASDQPGPAGFGPLPPDFPQRTALLGAFDRAWLSERWPHLPADTDVGYFQAAPHDQQLPGYWQGGERVLVRNMHPRHADLAGTVPALRPRFFICRTPDDAEASFIELEVNADTLWLLPEQQLGLLLYRGAIEAHGPEARDISCFFAQFEETDEPELPAEHYLEQCLRLVMPDAFEGGPDHEALIREHAGLPDQALLHRLSQEHARYQQTLAEAGLDDEAFLQHLLQNPHTRRFARLIQEHSGTPGGLLRDFEGLLQALGDDTPQAAAKAPGLEALAHDAAPTAPLVPPAPLASAHAALLQDDTVGDRNRQQLMARITQGLPCTGMDLSQVNLAGKDLAGVDFSGSILTGAQFSGARLQGSRLDECHLQGARFDAANLAGCRMTQATLDQASFVGANLQGAALDGSDCSGANFSGADLSGASLQGTQFTQAWLEQVAAARIQAAGADFSHANLQGIDLERAALDGASFIGARLRQASLDRASCTAANFTQADLSHASLERCDLSNSQSTPGTQWQGAQLGQAILDQASWVGAMLEDARMLACRAHNADFSDASLGNSRLSDCDLRGAVFDRADLRHADLSRSNLMEASFVEADLSHARLEHSNLYAATLMDTTLDGTRLHGANIDATLLKARMES